MAADEDVEEADDIAAVPEAPAPAPAVPVARPAETRRPEPTAASVFASFPKRERADDAPPEPKPEDIGGKTKRRQPFSKQRARTMRP
jgi:hypothetical protein